MTTPDPWQAARERHGYGHPAGQADSVPSGWPDQHARYVGEHRRPTRARRRAGLLAALRYRRRHGRPS